MFTITLRFLVNPIFHHLNNFSSSERCGDFAVHFGDKIDNIRSDLVQHQSVQNLVSEHVSVCEETLKSFVLVDAVMLSKVV